MARLGILNSLPLKFRRLARIDAREARARRPVFTVETLSALKGELHFVCGQDSAASFPKWRDPSRLKKLAAWWYGARPGSKAVPPPHFKRIPGTFPDISSTEIRSDLALGRDCSKILAPAVLDYIKAKALYGNGVLLQLSTALPPNRYEHTLNVAALAESLARKHGADPEKARLAGLLHDIGRRYNPEELARYARRRKLQVPELRTLLRLDPMLIHAFASADIARREFGVADKDVLNAIRRHTLGDKHLNLLDKILYVADASSLDRSHTSAAATRSLAFTDLDAALARCVADKLRHAIARDAWLHPLTINLWNSLARL